MKATICDFCQTAIGDKDKLHIITIDSENSRDCCLTCFESPVILSEMRRTRTHKPAAKTGRPKGSKNKKISPSILVAEGVPDVDHLIRLEK